MRSLKFAVKKGDVTTSCAKDEALENKIIGQISTSAVMEFSLLSSLCSRPIRLPSRFF